ncbi:MAG: hypothetical protein IPK58_13235 [Acidobacteria bacterium]|nr:hypothetical protein [Acidobacteriota bacterium]
MCSASILQGKLTPSVLFHIRETLGNPLTDALAAIESRPLDAGRNDGARRYEQRRSRC